MSKESTEIYGTEKIISHIDSYGKGLSKWEIGFISNLIDNPPKNYSEKVIDIINRIYNEKC